MTTLYMIVFDNIDKRQEWDVASSSSVKPPVSEKHLDVVDLELPGPLSGAVPHHPPLPLRPPRHPAALSDKLSASNVGTGRLTCSLAVVLLAQANSSSRLEAQLCQYCAALIST